ncbi:MAG: 30S ribosomal protein S1 [Bacteroidetes bacterium]|nr:30S ribosomal protein S1 [Bacteroidota bacterium]
MAFVFNLKRFNFAAPKRRNYNLTEEKNLNPEESTKSAKATKTQPELAQKVHNPDDFDWSMDGAGFGNYSKAEKESMEQLYSKTLATLTVNEIVEGKVVSITDKEVVLDVGFKSDGIISKNEFRDMPELKIGDKVKVYVEQTEDASGQLILSRKKALQENSWIEICKAMEEDQVLKGLVTSRTKGGLVVDVMGIDAFLPGSQIDTKPIRDYDQFVGKEMEFKVVKVNETFRNVVISHKALIEDDIEAQKSEILSSLEKGQVLEGVVKNMTSFGVFVDLGGVDGLLHITDISWGRINHPEEVLHLDQKINVVVLDFDDEKKRISLGMKQLSEHPWDSLDESIKVGAKVKGKIVTVADYGAFLEIQPGVEGLIHVSEMSWSQHLRNPSDFLNVGDEIEAVVLTFEKEERKISLGIKQLTPDPWQTIQEKYAIGSKHTGIVKNLTSYGLFVELEEGVDGLVHVSDLSWTKKIKHPAEFIKKDEKIDVIVLEIDSENRRLSLGHKQLEENPWDAFESIFKVGTRHEATIVDLNDKGATVQLTYGIEGFIPKRHLATQDNTLVKEEQTIEAEVIEFNKDAKTIILSHTVIWKAHEDEKKDSENKKKEKQAKSTSKTVNQINQANEKTTLGELGSFDNLIALFDNKDTKEEKKPVKKEEKKPVKKAEAKDSSKKDEPKVDKAKKAKADDLKKLSGVGPAFEKRLIAIGIDSYAKLAALTEDDVKKLEEKDNITSWSNWEKWIEEAKAIHG